MGSLITLIQRMLSGALNALRITTIQEEFFVGGKSFSFEDYFSFDADEVKTIVFDPTPFSGNQIIFNPILVSATSGPVTIDFYTDVVSPSDGTELIASNRREGQANPASKLWENPTTPTLTTRFAGDLVPSTGVAPANSSGGGNIPSLPFEIDKTKKHAFVLTNENGAGVLVQIKITWFEV